MGSASFVLLRPCHSLRVKPRKAGLNLPQSSNCDGDISRPRRYKRYIGLQEWAGAPARRDFQARVET